MDDAPLNPLDAEPPQATVERWAAAFNAGDLEALVAAYHPDAHVFGTTAGDPVHGHDGVRRYFGHLPGSGSGVQICSAEYRALSGRTALCTGFCTFSRPENGGRSELPARFTFVLVREGRRWLIAHHHSSPRPALRS